MATIESLPTEILLRILSHLKTYELTKADRVCQRWQLLIQEYVWNRLTLIDTDMIDSLHQNCSKNFIEIANRVRQVKDIFTIIQFMCSRVPLDDEVKKDVKNAMLELVKKRTEDTIFCLDVVEDILNFEYPKTPDEQQQNISAWEGRLAVAKILDEYKFNEFEAIRINDLRVHDPESRSDPFIVSYKGRDVPMPLELTRITRLIIENLIVNISFVDWLSVLSARSYFSRISLFTHLESVQIDRIHLKLYSLNQVFGPVLGVTLEFYPHPCRIGADEFFALLSALAARDDMTRNREIVRFINRWKESRCVTSGDMTIHSGEFHRIESLIRARAQPNRTIRPEDDPIDIIIAAVFPALIDMLYLKVSLNYNDDEQFLFTLLEHGIIKRLKEFSLTLEYDQEGDIEEVFDGDVFEGTRKTQNLLNPFIGNFQKLSELDFLFTCSERFHLSTYFDPSGKVSASLPPLLEVLYQGLPCFPFLLSTVAVAPNLRKVKVRSESFDDEIGCIEWTLKLLNALNGSKTLRQLVVNVNREPSPWIRERRARQPDQYRRDSALGRQLMATVESQVAHLVSTLPKLSSVEVSIHSHNYYFRLMGRNP